MREILLFIHPTLGILGMLGALWIFVEILRPDEAGLRRIRIASVLVAGAFALTWISGGIWDSAYYEADRAVMASGAWALAGNLTMETKEHLIVLILLMAFYLPLLAFGAEQRRLQAVRLPLMTVAGLIVLNTLAMEGFGAVLAQSVHVGATAMLAGQ